MTPDPTSITLIGAVIVSVVASIAAGAVTIITALRQSTRIDVIGQKTAAIEGHVNSEKTASEGRELALRNEIVLLREMITDKRTSAALLAQASATRGRDVPAVPIVVSAAPILGDAAIESLKSIDSNTAATVEALKKDAP